MTISGPKKLRHDVMANSAFRISEGKRYESSYGECSGSSFVVNQSNHDEVTKISDIMTLRYENNQCQQTKEIKKLLLFVIS